MRIMAQVETMEPDFLMLSKVVYCLFVVQFACWDMLSTLRQSSPDDKTFAVCLCILPKLDVLFVSICPYLFIFVPCPMCCVR